MELGRILGWIVAGILLGAACTEWGARRLLGRTVVIPVLSRLTPAARAALACAGLLCGIGDELYVRWRHAHELALTDGRVIVTALPPGESLFPIQVIVQNEFERMTDVQLRCMVERFSTSAVDFLDADVTSRAETRALDKGGSFRFDCPAPPELKPPFHSADVRGAHMTVDVLFSVADRWRRVGVRQGFDLSVGSGAPSWSREPVVLRL